MKEPTKSELKQRIKELEEQVKHNRIKLTVTIDKNMYNFVKSYALEHSLNLSRGTEELLNIAQRAI